MAAADDLARVLESERSPTPVARPPQSFWEVRVGATAHDPWSPERGSADFNGELLLGWPVAKADAWIPRFHVGASINTSGKTSYGYSGVTWTFDIVDSIFIEGSFGGAVHNGSTGDQLQPGHNALGCSPLFRESGAVGFRLTENWSWLVTVDHMSNAGLCGHVNRGLTNVGGKIGYRF
jgi:hypothetical protein